ncbi:MAG: thiamine-phosphate kinase [Proteobacteria bacterium]|nr:thiamine-phosphate kinase [Pseudomonadota bacterium]
MDPGEHASIARWAASLPSEGIGDDVAWVGVSGNLAVSVDTMVEEVHFRRAWTSARTIGHRAVMAALSDLAAARARPLGLLAAVSVPAFDRWADGLMAGVGDAAREVGTVVLGGDTTASPGPAVISITVLGSATDAGPLLRSGAQVGDGVYVSGPLGASAWATEMLLLGEDVAWPAPRARLDLVDALGPATAGIDISDGLLADAAHVARASGIDLVLDRDAVAVPGVPERCTLSGGEDWELLAASPVPIEGMTRIGEVKAGDGVVRFVDGSPLPDALGWDHGC